jgi:hypothetical protein
MALCHLPPQAPRVAGDPLAATGAMPRRWLTGVLGAAINKRGGNDGWQSGGGAVI